jgi:hypothetical protein
MQDINQHGGIKTAIRVRNSPAVELPHRDLHFLPDKDLDPNDFKVRTALRDELRQASVAASNVEYPSVQGKDFSKQLRQSFRTSGKNPTLVQPIEYRHGNSYLRLMPNTLTKKLEKMI